MHRMLLALAPVVLSMSVGTGNAAGNEIRKPDDLDLRLKSTVVQALGQLGELPAWQKRLFEDEVIPNYSRFVKEYRVASVGGVPAEADFNALRNYLRYRAPGTQILVYLNVEAACGSCKDVTPTIQGMVKARMERRGLNPTWVSDEELGQPKPVGKALNDKILDLAQQRNAAAVLVLGWRTAPIDSIDRAHAEEKRFLMTSYLNVRGLHRVDGRLELAEPPVFDTASAQLLTEAFTEVGAKMELAEATTTDPTKEEVTIALTGFKNYAEYAKLRDGLQEKLKAIATLEERKISRGKVVFAVITEKPAEEVKRVIAGFEAPVPVEVK